MRLTVRSPCVSGNRAWPFAVNCHIRFGRPTAPAWSSNVTKPSSCNVPRCWLTTAFVASSIVAAAGSAVVSGSVGNRRAFCLGAVVYAAGAALCALSPSIGLVIAGRFVQGLGGGLLNALAYVLVRNVFPQGL